MLSEMSERDNYNMISTTTWSKNNTNESVYKAEIDSQT